MSPALLTVLLAVLGTVTVGLLLLVTFYPCIAAEAALNNRVLLVSGGGQTAAVQDSIVESSRKRSVEDTLHEADEKRRAKNPTRPTFMVRMRQADLTWSKHTYALIGAAVGGSVMVLSLFFGLGMLPGVGFAISSGVLLPHLYVSRRRNGRLRKFSAEFPNAVDVIVRGVKAGLPLVDCLKIVASEAQEPVRSEFKTLVQDQTMGMPLDEAVQRLPDRVPLTEATFFAIVIAIQSRTGGSLSEALGNLSKVLRERKKMQAKVKAMSSEAKASGGIIAALPVIVGVLVYFSSPQYISLLFTTAIGNVVLIGCAFWMLIGVLVMRKMINFDL
jgi:tight adherence protein B